MGDVFSGGRHNNEINILGVMANKKSNKIEHEKHILECVRKIVMENASYDEWQRFTTNEYQISHSAGNDIWKEAWKRIKEKSSKDVQSKVDLMLKKLDAIEAEAIDNNDRKIWLETTKYRGKIYGVEDNKLNVILNHEISFDFGTADDPADPRVL